MLNRDIFILIFKYLDIRTISLFIIQNKKSYESKQLFYDQLLRHNFYILIHSTNKYLTLVKNIKKIFENSVIRTNMSYEGFQLSHDQTSKDSESMVINGESFQYYNCLTDISYVIPYQKLEKMSQSISENMKLYIYKKISENIVHIFLYSIYEKKIKIHFKFRI